MTGSLKKLSAAILQRRELFLLLSSIHGAKMVEAQELFIKERTAEHHTEAEKAEIVIQAYHDANALIDAQFPASALAHAITSYYQGLITYINIFAAAANEALFGAFRQTLLENLNKGPTDKQGEPINTKDDGKEKEFCAELAAIIEKLEFEKLSVPVAGVGGRQGKVRKRLQELAA